MHACMHIEKEEKAGIHAYVSKDLAITNLGFFLTLISTLTRNNLFFFVTVNNSLYIKRETFVINVFMHSLTSVSFTIISSLECLRGQL